MGTLIDSSVLVAAERGRFDLADWMERQGDETFALSVITASELLHGVHRAPAGRRREARRVQVERLLETVPVYAIDLVTARVYAELWAALATRGRIIGAHDLWIAATALAAGFAVATLNEREFRHVEGLTVVNPTATAASASG